MYVHVCVFVFCSILVFRIGLIRVRYMYIYVPFVLFKALYEIAKLLLEVEEKQKIEEKQKASALWRLSRQVCCYHCILHV